MHFIAQIGWMKVLLSKPPPLKVYLNTLYLGLLSCLVAYFIGDLYRKRGGNFFSLAAQSLGKSMQRLLIGDEIPYPDANLKNPVLGIFASALQQLPRQNSQGVLNGVLGV